ncbi:TPR domain protein (kinesin light chain) [Paraphaeosphaeria sporulosa]
MSRYAEAHTNPAGPGDTRPTAVQIIMDEAAEGRLTGKVIVITGTSSGLGVETARALSLTGAKLFLTARDLNKAKKALNGILEPGRIELVDMDNTSLDSVQTAAKAILQQSNNQVNILINNAGIMAMPKLEYTKDGFEMQFGVNHLAHFLLFQLLKPALLATGASSRTRSTMFHLPLERPETPPNPSAVIPFTRDEDFVKRTAVLDQIQQNCAVTGSRTALVGLGGVGRKSQLALEYAYRTREKSPETWVFWVYASNAARFEQSYRDIADCVKIFRRRDPQANIFRLVHDWLRDSKERWMLILDDIDDPHFLLDAHAHSHSLTRDSETAPKPLQEYFPTFENGRILITTRNQEAALKLVEQRDIVTVETMDETQALALFEKKLGVQGDSNDVAELAAALEYMPLAIVQAAAYISQRSPPCSVRQYLEKFKKSERKWICLLNHEEGQLRRDWEAKNCILVTWQISFEHIRQTRSSAADLLSLMSFFDRQGISKTLLRNRAGPGDAQENQKEPSEDGVDSDEDESALEPSASEDQFEDDVVMLRNFSLIIIKADGTSFQMHALVQLVTRKWLEANGKLEQWKQHFIHNLYAECPTSEYGAWGRCQALFVHAKSAAAQQPERGSSVIEWATLLYSVAWYAWMKGSVAEAEKLAVKSMRARRKVLGQEHEDTVLSMEMVGLVYNLEGQWDAAEELQVQVTETRKSKLGPDHPDTLTSMANLATTYMSEGRWEQAGELQVQVMETYKNKLGPDHPDTLTSMNNLASTYRSQGQLKRAEELDVQVMEMRKSKLGPDHPDTLASMNNLAFTWKKQRRDAEAISLMKECGQLQQRVLGVDHPRFISSLTTIAEWEME